MEPCLNKPAIVEDWLWLVTGWNNQLAVSWLQLGPMALKWLLKNAEACILGYKWQLYITYLCADVLAALLCAVRDLVHAASMNTRHSENPSSVSVEYELPSFPIPNCGRDLRLTYTRFPPLIRHTGENVSLSVTGLTTAPTTSTAIIPNELQSHGACQGLKGPAHHVSLFHFS